MELWNYGIMELWNYGFMELWNYGMMDLWNYGFVDLWGEKRKSGRKKWCVGELYHAGLIRRIRESSVVGRGQINDVQGLPLNHSIIFSCAYCRYVVRSDGFEGLKSNGEEKNSIHFLGGLGMCVWVGCRGKSSHDTVYIRPSKSSGISVYPDTCPVLVADQLKAIGSAGYH